MGRSSNRDGKSGTSTQPVVLVGMMGAGKSTVGRRLAQRLALPFADADLEIERAAGCSISDIFEFHGEASFREGERRVIKRILEGPPLVISTGGGAFIDPETHKRIRAKALSIWLRADLDTVVKRVKHNTNRPLLKDGDPRTILEKLMIERDPTYAKADVVVDSGDTAVEKIVDAIVAAIHSRQVSPR
jgi:shikimate kinase